MASGLPGKQQVGALQHDGLESKKFTVDLSKPIVFQVGHLGEEYDDWVHQAIPRKETPRFFENDILEFLTRTKWWLIPTIWVPVVMWTQMRALADGLPAQFIVPSFMSGVLLWTLFEYCIHRFAFHIKASSYWAITFHYLIHGFHHKHPMDADRLVFPPLFTFIIAFPLWHIGALLIPRGVAPSLSGGVLFGYIAYDLTHFFLHYGAAFTKQLYEMKKLHSDHHFKNKMHNYNFGVTSTFWDKVFGTLPPTKQGSKKEVVRQVYAPKVYDEQHNKSIQDSRTRQAS